MQTRAESGLVFLERAELPPNRPADRMAVFVRSEPQENGRLTPEHSRQTLDVAGGGNAVMFAWFSSDHRHAAAQGRPVAIPPVRGVSARRTARWWAVEMRVNCACEAVVQE